MYLKLKANVFNGGSIEERLELAKVQNSIMTSEAVFVVYQDVHYSLLLNLEEDEGLRFQEVYVNNQGMNYTVKWNAEAKEYLIEFKTNIFNLVYGVTDISIVLQGHEMLEETYYSSLLAVAIKEDYEETMKSVHDMLDEIYLKEHYLLQSELAENTFDMKKLSQRENKLECEISFLKKLLLELKIELPMFINNAKTVPVNVEQIDSFEKMRAINNQNIKYIVSHPNELKLTTIATGINAGRQYYVPQRTMISTISTSKNSIENYAIICFLNTVILYVQKVVSDLSKEIKDGGDARFEKREVKSGYIISFLIIEQYLKISLKKYLVEFQAILKALQILVPRYKRELVDTQDALKMLPMPSATFLELYHYRKIYESMVQWYSSIKVNLPNRTQLLHFHTADKIYEYYCLLNLMDCLISLGFSEDASKRTRYIYEIDGYERFLNDNEANTFYFADDKGMELVLYYQPVIYSRASLKRNGISLFRTDRSYYTPDFIVKVTSEDNVKYGILDSKWRNRNRIQADAFQESVYKYFACVFNEAGFSTIDFLWLLQGKDDVKHTQTYYHQRGSIIQRSFSDKKKMIGVVKLTPKTGATEMMRVLKELLG